MRVSGKRELSSACVRPSCVTPVVAPPGSVVAPGRPYAVRVLVVVFPSGVELTDSDGVVEYVHVRLTAFVIVSIAPRTSYVRDVVWPKSRGATPRKPNEFSIASKRPQKASVLDGLDPLVVTPCAKR